MGLQAASILQGGWALRRPLQNYLSVGQKRRGGLAIGTEKLAGPYGVSQGALGLQAAFRRSRKGRSVTPSKIFHQGGEIDAVKERIIWGLTGTDRESKENRLVWTVFVFKRGRSVAPFGMICQGRQNRRGGRKGRKDTR